VYYLPIVYIYCAFLQFHGKQKKKGRKRKREREREREKRKREREKKRVIEIGSRKNDSM